MASSAKVLQVFVFLFLTEVPLVFAQGKLFIRYFLVIPCVLGVLERSNKCIRQRNLVTSVALCACLCRRRRGRGHHWRRGGRDHHHSVALNDRPRHPLQSPQSARAL